MDKPSGSKSLLSVQAIVLAEIAWAVLALLFFLLFSVPLPGQGRPVWYSLGTSVFEAVAFLAATVLCLRNWRSPQIVSGRNVWLGIGLGMLFYFVGNLFFTYWETGLGLEAAVSPGDFFFVLTYIFLIWGMVLAVASRRLNLEIWQWGIVSVIAAVGIILAVLTAPGSNSPQALFMQPAVAQTAPAQPQVPAKATPKVAAPTKAPTTSAPVPAAPQAAPTTAPAQKPAPPAWATSLETQLAPLETPLNWFYVGIDVLLLIIAATLLLAFWGGRFAQSWRMIAAAAFSLYIADMWFKYATTHIQGYQSGDFLEVFWVFSGVLFGIGAALEYDLSSRSRSRTGGRRRAS